jgi:TPR repeat protein
VLQAALWASLLGSAGAAQASSTCPGGMWSSNDSCCELGNEYVASKNQCLPVRPERRCVEGHLDDCVVAGRQLEQRGDIGAGYAAELYKYACDEGHAPACRGLGSLHERGLGVERDASRGHALYEQACEGGDAPACTLLAEKMIGEASTSTQALALFAQACHRGDAHACDAYGEQLALRPEHSKQSGFYFERACVGGIGSACRTLLSRERAAHVREAHAIDPARVRELLERGCRAADAESCTLLDRARAEVR